MIRNVVGCAFFALTLISVCVGQGNSYVDSIRSNANYEVFEYNMNIPIGHTFMKMSKVEGVSFLRTHMPDGHTRPMVKQDTSADRISTNFSPLSCHSDNSTVAASSMRGEDDRKYEYHVENVNATPEPHKFIWELSPDPDQAMALGMHLGLGSARLDLSDLSVKTLKIFSGASDVYVSYDQPNRSRMDVLEVEGGMSKIVLRNVEQAHAEKVHVLNGMGNTKVVIGNNFDSSVRSSNITIEAGAGTCLLMVHEDAPVKVIIMDNLFSTVDVDTAYKEADEDTYLSPAYLTNAKQAVTVHVDLGVGKFELITFSK